MKKNTMKQMRNKLFGTFILLGAAFTSQAQADWNSIGAGVIHQDSTTRQGYTLIFVNKSADFDTAIGRRMTDAFFTVYPVEAKLYNPKTLRKVFFVVDPEYKGVAATAGGIVRYNPEWFKKHPGDIDVVTHEVMHIVQAYPGGSGPGWITEGIADYVRYTLGVDNAGAGWSLPEYNAKHHYDNAYRITARFLVWIEKSHKGFVQKLDAVMRSKTYQDSFWKEQTGKTVSELWDEYAANPGL
ncbi:MAG: basic secretory protein-like protein [Chitinophagaceae bacterium]